MKKAKKSRVSWPSDNMLCQVKMFLTEDCPAKVASQSSRNPKASNLNLPPGFEATQYAMKRPNISRIPRIKWKRPPKYILNDALLVASGEESTETRVENLRISKVFEAFYPHRSVIPTSPSVSQAVEDESYDDNKTPNIRLTPVEDELEAALESSHCNNSETPAAVSGLGPDLSMVVSAALMKAKEHGSLVDADLLVKLLSDPIIIKNLMNEMAGKPLETENSTLNTNITVPRVAPQHVTSSAMDRNSPPNRVTQPGNGVSHTAPVSVQPSVSVATDQPLSKPVSSALSMSLNLQKPPQVCRTYPLTSGIKPLPRLQDSYSTGPLKPSTVDAVVVSQPKTAPKPQSQSLDISTSSTWNTNKVSESGQTGTNPQISNGAYSLNINRADQVSAKPPVKNLDYFKSLIREHGRVAQATNDSNNYKGRVDNNNNKNNTKVVKAKFQKPCMYFGRARGCKLGESCLYLHDHSKRMWTADVAAEFPRAKRLKFGT